LFIKPSVMAMNIMLWAKVDQQQRQALQERAAEAARGRQAGTSASNEYDDAEEGSEEGEADGGEREILQLDRDGEDMWDGLWPEGKV
jgi:TRAP-type C4-dicarboxylate transport system substrate-binding protein